MEKVRFRFAQQGDAALILKFIRDLAFYRSASDPPCKLAARAALAFYFA